MQLREWVQEQGTTVEAVAERLGIKRVALQRLMAGRTFPSRRTRAAIDRASGGRVTISELLAAYNTFWNEDAGLTRGGMNLAARA